VSDYGEPVLGVPEQTEQDVREIERSYDQPPDEPHPRYASPYAGAAECVQDALSYLNDPDPEAALASLREAVARIEAAI